MPLHIACPSCAAVLAIPEGAGGQTVACPTCGRMMTLPSEPPPPARRSSASPPAARPRSRRRERDDGDDDTPRVRRIKTGPPSTQSHVVGAFSVIVNVVMFVALIFGLIASGIYETSKPRVDALSTAKRDEEPPPTTRRANPTLPADFRGFERPSDNRDPVPAPFGWTTQEIPGVNVRVATPWPLRAAGTVTLEGTEYTVWTTDKVAGRLEYQLLISADGTGTPVPENTSKNMAAGRMRQIFEGQHISYRAYGPIRVGGREQYELIYRTAGQQICGRVASYDPRYVAGFVITPIDMPYNDPQIHGFLDNIRP